MNNAVEGKRAGLRIVAEIPSKAARRVQWNDACHQRDRLARRIQAGRKSGDPRDADVDALIEVRDGEARAIGLAYDPYLGPPASAGAGSVAKTGEERLPVSIPIHLDDGLVRTGRAAGDFDAYRCAARSRTANKNGAGGLGAEDPVPLGLNDGYGAGHSVLRPE
jgi:hypothetical protein